MGNFKNLRIITQSLHIANFIFTAILTALTSYYTWGYTKIPKDLVYKPISIMFLVYIILSWINIFLKFLTFRTESKNLGKAMNVYYWTYIDPENRYPWCFLKLNRIPRYVIGLAFVAMFGNISGDNCVIYENGSIPCLVLQLITVLNYIRWGAICIVMIVVFLVWLYILYSQCRGREVVFDSNSIIVNYPDGYVFTIRYSFTFDLRLWLLPVQGSDMESDMICTLCCKDLRVGERKTVQCGENHTFHSDCVDYWLMNFNRCPSCITNKTCLYYV
jgi:hypothetical protein